MKKYEDTIREYLVERKWDQLRPADIAKSISIESAELLELFQWTNQTLEEVRNDPKKLELIKGELADVFIYCLDMSVLLGFDTGEIVLEKLERAKKKYPAELFNSTEDSRETDPENVYWKIKRESRGENS
ncbi:nucleotide pyrophosphohydrolase [Patescibacteria group bacterium]|nr:nucleotide pyrophosphohydrolase [Patescibacteria group bacterium]MBU1500887.1 nucleotide pyrophosphohydrolase [Patescibacteria group bacterium]MBU2080942.1 nucleotide pyrophosphohydrolase [Patescibacteria group bacterium]MBU2124047.1 nucleotide pyrophosphohydrolase [Patescibacteria group bacterium]MBU2194662.1 nucleotide pyrophosphohydrolase [Patescibacteria group bacterium]